MKLRFLPYEVLSYVRSLFFNADVNASTHLNFGIIVFSLIVFSSASYAEVSAKIELSSARIYRGIQQDDDNFSPSALIKYQSDNGIYTGALLSRNDFRLPNQSIEQAYFAGYSSQLNNLFHLDLSYLAFNFSGGSSDTNWQEAHIRLSYDQTTSLTLSTANNWLLQRSSIHLELNRIYSVTDQLSLHALIGAVTPKNDNLEDFFYSELGVIYGATPSIYLRADLTASNSSAKRNFNDRADSTFRLSIGYVF